VPPPDATDAPASLPRQLDILQVYRGVAAMLVVLFHLTWWGGEPRFLALPHWLTPSLSVENPAGFFLFGHSGVDFFFVLSGFVITWRYASEVGDIRRLLPFLRARFVRIYPTYWVVFGLTAVYRLFRQWIDDKALADAGTLLRGFALYGVGPWLVPPAGTLPSELVLYIFFAAAFVLGPRLFAVAAAAWCSLIVAQWTGWIVVRGYTTLLSPMLLEFFLGCLGAVFIQRVRPRWSGRWLALAAALYVPIAVADSVGVAIGIHQNVLTFALPYLALILTGVAYELQRPRAYPRLLMLLGDASFSIYLTHYYLILESDWQFLRHPGIAATIGHDAARVLALVVILAIGIAFWALVERPLLHALRPSAPSPP